MGEKGWVEWRDVKLWGNLVRRAHHFCDKQSAATP